jgi:hypothetical protein
MPHDLQDQLRQAGRPAGLSSLSTVLRVAGVEWLKRQSRPDRKTRLVVKHPAGLDHPAGTESQGKQRVEGAYPPQKSVQDLGSPQM